MRAAAILSLMMGVNFVLTGGALYGALKLLRAPRPHLGIVAGIVALGPALSVVALGLVHWADDSIPAMLVGLLALGVVYMGAVFALLRRMGLSSLPAIGGFLLFYVVSIVIGLALVVPMRWLLVEAFAATSNSMAPTILGKHRLGACPHCQGPFLSSYHPDLERWRGADKFYQGDGICADCWRSAENVPLAPEVHDADRFAVDKTTRPARWDLLVYRFRPPGQPPQLRVQRLVGLPGETIELRDGQLWIDGQRAELPDDLRLLRYTTGAEYDAASHALVAGRQLALGPGEYFVLGDNSSSAMDGRYHGPVAESDLVGVATLLYWPPERWRIWR
jgi:signal peptidase I